MNTYLERRNNSRNPLRFNLDSFFDYDWPGVNTKLPAVNVAENDNNFTVEVVAPGFKKDDFKLKVEDDILTITGETKQENKENGKQDEECQGKPARAAACGVKATEHGPSCRAGNSVPAALHRGSR